MNTPDYRPPQPEAPRQWRTIDSAPEGARVMLCGWQPKIGTRHRRLTGRDKS